MILALLSLYGWEPRELGGSLVFGFAFRGALALFMVLDVEGSCPLVALEFLLALPRLVLTSLAGTSSKPRLSGSIAARLSAWAR